jgi:hypothetical protein
MGAHPRNKPVSTGTQRSSPLPGGPSTPLKANLLINGMHSSPPDAPRWKGTLGSRNHIMSSPPSPSPRHRTRPIQVMMHSSPSTPSSRTLSQPGKKISRERLFLTSTQSSISAYSRLGRDSTSENPRNNEASMLYPQQRGTNAFSRELPQSQRVGVSGVRSTDRPPILQQAEESGASDTRPPNESVPSSAKEEQPYEANLSAMGSQSDAGQMGDLTVISRVPILHSFSTQTSRGQFPTRRSALQRGVLVKSSPSARGRTNSLAPNLSSPVKRSFHPNKLLQSGLRLSGQLVRSTQFLNQNVERTRLGPQGEQNRHHAVKQCVDTPPAHREPSPDPSIEMLQVQQMRDMQSSPLKRPQQTRGNNTIPDPLILGLPQQTESAERQFASALPHLLPKPAQETGSSTIVQSFIEVGQPAKSSSLQSFQMPVPLQLGGTVPVQASALAVRSPELPFTPTQQIAISTQVSSPLLSHPPNTSLQADPKTGTSKDSRVKSSAFSTPGMRHQSSNLDPRGARLAHLEPTASFSSRQQPSSSPRSKSNSLLPTPSNQMTGSRLNPAQNNHLQTRHPGSQPMAIPTLPQNLYPPQGRQKRRLDSENDMNPKAKRQNTNTNLALDRSNVPGSSCTRPPAIYDLEEKIKGFTGKLVLSIMTISLTF